MKELYLEINRYLTNEKNKPLMLNLPSETAFALATWLKRFEVNDTSVWDGDKRDPYEERFFPMIFGRFKKAFQESTSETNVPIELTYREVDLLGDRLYKFNRSDPEVFIELNAAFVKAGGRDNRKLRRAFELIKRE